MNARGWAAFVVTQDAGPGFVPGAQVDEIATMSINGTSISTPTTMHRNSQTVR